MKYLKVSIFSFIVLFGTHQIKAQSISISNDISNGDLLFMDGTTQIMRLDRSKGLLIGSDANANAILDIDVTTSGILIPRLSATEISSLSHSAAQTSMLVYNTTDKKFNFWETNAGAWIEILSGTGSGDHLGNHTAIQNLKLNGNWLSNDGGNEGIRIDNSGNVHPELYYIFLKEVHTAALGLRLIIQIIPTVKQLLM